MGWSETDLQARPKGEPRKLALAWQLRSQTTLPLAWIAERLSMGGIWRGYSSGAASANSLPPPTSAC